MKKAKGFVLWKGPSVLDGKPVVLIAIRGAKNKANTKTGRMVQTYILRADCPPIEAVRQGKDASICGNCAHRPALNGTCYVRLDTGPNTVYRAWKRGEAYTDKLNPLEASYALNGEYIRLGTYGDPAAIPLKVWRDLVTFAGGWTGYTHQWRRPDSQGLAAYCMASCDSEEETKEAQALHWRTFSVVPTGYLDSNGIPKGAMLCPASERAGKKLTCIECLACDGLAHNRRGHVLIPVHGVKFKKDRFDQLITIGGTRHAEKGI